MPNETKPKPDCGSTHSPDHIMLSICGDSRRDYAVTWRTSTDVTGGYMLYREENENDKKSTVNGIESPNPYPLTPNPYKRCAAFTKVFESDIDVSHMHCAKPPDLQPGTRYFYTVGDDMTRSEEFSFATQEENLDKFKFLLISDHQCSSPWEKPSYEPVKSLLKQVFEKHPDIRFILTAGDNCDNGQNGIQWNGMFEGMKGYIESVPYMMCTGNHDNRGYLTYLPSPAGKFYLPRAVFFAGQFENSYPLNGPEGLTGENYAFDYGNAHFAVMGINSPEAVNGWLYDGLQNTGKQWKIGVYHLPVYPLMPEGTNEDAYPFLRKGIEEGSLDILVAGHEHSLARTYPIKNEEMLDRPSEGVVHYIMGNGGRNIYHSNCRKIWHSAFHPQEEKQYMYTICEVDGAKIRFTAYMEDGRIADEFILDKEKDQIYPYALAPVYDWPKMAFKGMIPELASRNWYPKNIGGEWFCAFGSLAQFAGGTVLRDEDSIYIKFYKIGATFREGSEIADTSEGDVKLGAPVFRDNGQLYMACADCAEIFGLVWHYAERNNIIFFDSLSEDVPLASN
ncbi:MAG: metallophosphoesterase family protein [Oscillospiraceae bacterium]|nr:metallophosphoesterase family protein [Oscillospiraceae bacterium]